jgi:hypothetical protein
MKRDVLIEISDIATIDVSTMIEEILYEVPLPSTGNLGLRNL